LGCGVDDASAAGQPDEREIGECTGSLGRGRAGSSQRAAAKKTDEYSPNCSTNRRRKRDAHGGTWSCLDVWRREVVLVGDAAENPAGSTAGRPQLRGLTRQASSARPAAQSVPMAAFSQTACRALYTVSAQRAWPEEL
jgi:hypothetical protein